MKKKNAKNVEAIVSGETERMEKDSKFKEFMQGKKMRYGSVTLLLALILIVLVIAVQSAFALLQARVNLKLDLTRGNIYAMSEETVQFVNGIDRKIEIVVLASELIFDTVAPQQLEIIKKYAFMNENITLSFEDITYNPDYISGYDEDVIYGDILVKCGARYKFVKFTDLTLSEDTEDEDVKIEYSNAEDEMNSALVFVISDQTFTVAFTTGHSEGEVTEFKEFVKRNNYSVRDVNLSENPDLSDVDILVSVGPVIDFSDEELYALDSFLNNRGARGKSFVYMATITQEASPNLDEFLAEWGIRVTKDIVYQTESRMIYQGNFFETLASVPPSEMSFGILYATRTAGTDYSLYIPYSRKVDALFDAVGARQTRSILEFNGGARLSDVLITDSWTASEEDPAGIFTAALLSTEFSNNAGSRVLAFGSYTIASEMGINTGSFVNSKYLAQLFNSWVDKPVNDIIVNPVNITPPIFELTEGAASFAFWFFVVGLPGCTLLTGIAVFVRRRFL